MNKKYDNPFHSNHVFTEFDLERVKISFWEYPFLWLKPTYVQLSDGYAWHFKRDSSGRCFLMKQEKISYLCDNDEQEEPYP